MQRQHFGKSGLEARREAVRLGHSLRDEGDTGGAENAFRQAVWVDDSFAAAHDSLTYLLRVKEAEQAQKAAPSSQLTLTTGRVSIPLVISPLRQW